MYDDTVMVDKAYYNKLKEQTTWISVKDRLPEIDGFYLCWFTFEDGVHGYDIFYYNCGVSLPSSLTHWRPLPEPPESEEE